MSLNTVLFAGGGILDRCSGHVSKRGLTQVFIKLSSGDEIGVSYRDFDPPTSFFNAIAQGAVKKGDSVEGWVSRGLDRPPRYENFTVIQKNSLNPENNIR